MTELKETKKNNILLLPNQEHVNISFVYDRAFFNIFHFQDYHVRTYGKNEPIEDPEVYKGDIPLQGSNELQNDESDLHLATSLLGREKYPDGYNTLPLTFDQQGGNKESYTILGNIESTLSREYDKYSKSVSFLPKYKEPLQEKLVDPNLTNKDLRIFFPKLDYEVKHVSSLLNSDKEYIDRFSTSLSYHTIENIIKDIIFQLDYLENQGITYSSLSPSSLYQINDRFVILDSEKIEILREKKQNKHLYTSIFHLIVDLIGKSRYESIENVQYTKLYHCMNRLEKEHVLVWV